VWETVLGVQTFFGDGGDTHFIVKPIPASSSVVTARFGFCIPPDELETPLKRRAHGDWKTQAAHEVLDENPAHRTFRTEDQ
jgi:hypothetical protein